MNTILKAERAIVRMLQRFTCKRSSFENMPCLIELLHIRSPPKVATGAFGLALIVALLTSCHSTSFSAFGSIHRDDADSVDMKQNRSQVHSLTCKVGKDKLLAVDLYTPLKLSVDYGEAKLNKSPNNATAIIVSHGNGGRKESFRMLGEHLASVGMPTLVPQLPNRNQWTMAAEYLASLAQIVRVASDINDKICSRKDRRSYSRSRKKALAPRKVVLIGHSFGGAASLIAATRLRPRPDVIALDPAWPTMLPFDLIKDLRSKVTIIGADPRLYRARQQKSLRKVLGNHQRVRYRFIEGATHDEAQYPTTFALSGWGINPYVKTGLQETYLENIAASLASSIPTANTSGH